MTATTPSEPGNEPLSRRVTMPPRPVTRVGATSTRMSADDHGTMYAPTSMSVDTGGYVEVWCPMEFEVGQEHSVVITLGGANNELRLWFSDEALIKFTRLTNEATRTMLRTRGIPISGGIGRTSE